MYNKHFHIPIFLNDLLKSKHLVNILPSKPKDANFTSPNPSLEFCQHLPKHI